MVELRLIENPSEVEKRKEKSYSHDHNQVWTYVEHMLHANFELKGLQGKRVLEIGGAHPENIGNYCLNELRAGYTNRTLDEKCKDLPHTSIGEIMTFNDAPYDVVFSNGVFECGAIDFPSTEQMAQNTLRYIKWIMTNSQRVQKYNLNGPKKLYELTAKNGKVIINTISHPCIFTTHALEKAGFRVLARQRRDIYNVNTPSSENELVILEK